jgi:5'-methylthioadenosine phosphorylase
MILIIGGTAAYFLDLEAELETSLERIELDTPYGTAFPMFRLTNYAAASSQPVVFASRHGMQQLEVTPPFVNARANIWAAHELGVQAILSWNGVGAINPLLQLHDMLVLDGVLDFTKTREREWRMENSEWEISHDAHQDTRILPHTARLQPPVLRPFAPALSALLYRVARTTTERAFPVGLYACTEGPRLETSAEIQAYKRLGADVVGMTLVPEVLLAHELGMAYASLAYVTNYATGLEPAGEDARHFGVDVAHRCLRIVLATATADG